MTVKTFNAEELVNREPFKGACVNFVHSENMTLAEWKFDAEISLPEHSHLHEQITKIISGKLELTIDGQKYLLNSGSVAIIPPNAIHSAKTITNCYVVDVFNPVREDYR